MKIILKADSTEKENIEVTITNEGFDNNNFISVVVEDLELDFILEDLYLALKTFYDKNNKTQRDNML